MKRPIAFVILLLTSSFAALAQTSAIEGFVIDKKSHAPLVGVTVRLSLASDTSHALSVATDVAGKFRFDDVAYNEYTITATYVGYAYATKRITVDKPQISVGDLPMTVSAVQLGAVTVEGKVIPVEQKADTSEFNAAAFKVHPDADAGDLVTKMPGVTIDNTGVHAQGETVQQVLLDGKPFFGSDPLLALRNLPADAVDKIQVFDQMSDQAQFTGFDDGQSQRTINIITKRDKRHETFGKLYGGAGDDDRYSTGGSVNAFDEGERTTLIGLSNNTNQQNFSTQDILGVTNNTVSGGSAASGGGRRGRGGGRGGGGRGGGNGANPGNFLVGQQTGITNTNSIGGNFIDGFSDHFELTQGYFFNHTTNNNLQNMGQSYSDTIGGPQTYNNQSTNANSSNANHRLDTRALYTFDSANSIVFTPHLYFQGNNSVSSQTGALTGANALSFINNNGAEYTGNNLSSHLTLRHKFETPGRTISLDIGWNSNLKQGSGSIYSLQDSAGSDALVDERSSLRTDGYTIAPRLAYTEPVGSISQLQLTYNPSYMKNNSDNDRFAYDSLASSYSLPDTSLSNTYRNTYATQNAGLGYRIKFSNLSFMVNMSYQVASLDGTQVFPFSSEVRRTFYNLLPSSFINYEFSNHTNLRVFYRVSTASPTIAQLQNVINNSNQVQLTGGNPNLTQSYGQSLLMRYGQTSARDRQSLFLLLSVSETNNYIGNSVFTPASDTILAQGIKMTPADQLTTPVNLNNAWRVRSFLTYGLPVDAISSNLNLTGGYDYSVTPGLINSALNVSHTSSYSAGAVVASNISEDVDFTLSYAGTYNMASNSAESQLNTDYYSQTAGIKLNLIFLDGFVFRDEVDNTLYNGLGAGYDEDIWLWSLGLAHKFLPNERGELQASVNDLLNQNKSVTRTVTPTEISDTQNEVLGRYFLLTFTYTMR